MIAVSAAWKEAVRAQFRRQAYLKFTLEVSPPGLRDNVVSTSQQTNALSSVDTLTDHLQTPPKHFASLEPNRLILDGSMPFLESEESKTDDWWSAASSGDAAIHFQFDKTYSFPGVYIEWDVVSHSYPTSITLIGYDTFGAVKHTYEITNISSETGFINAVMENVLSAELIIHSWVNPLWLYRINEVTFGVYVEFKSENSGRIASASVSSSAQPIADSLPTYDMSITLRNVDKYFDPSLKNGISKYLTQRQLGKYSWGFTVAPGVVEWTDELPIYTKDFDIPEDSKDVTFNLTNRLSLLDSTFRKNTYTGSQRTMYEIAEYVLSNSPFILDFDGQKPWILNDSMKNVVTTAPIVKEDIPTILQYIALACRMWLTIDVSSGYIKFHKPDESQLPAQVVTPATELGDPSVEVKDRLRTITIAVYQYEVESETSDLGKGEYSIAGTQIITMEYSSTYASNVTAQVENAVLQSAVYYASYAIITVTAPLTGAEVVITLSGNVVKQNVSYIQTYEDESITYGREVVVENPLVTNSVDVKALSDFILNYESKRTLYKSSYSGFPEIESADKVEFETVYDSGTLEVISNSIDFDGGWSGTLEVI